MKFVTVITRTLAYKLKTHKSSYRRFRDLGDGRGMVGHAAGTNHNTGKRGCGRAARVRGLCPVSPYMLKYLRGLNKTIWS